MTDPLGFYPSGRRRPSWASLPAELRDRFVDSLAGSVSVVKATTQPGGFTSGAAAVLSLTDGSRVFVKAVLASDEMADAYRYEARIASQLPAHLPVPTFRFAIEAGGWVLSCFDAVDGRLPSVPWRDRELATVLEAMGELSASLTPSPLSEIPSIAEAPQADFAVWQALAETGSIGALTVDLLPALAQRRVDELAELEKQWPAEVVGDSLVHFDMRSDNMLIDAADKVWFVDWSWPCVAAPWVDLATFLPTVDRDARSLDALFCANRASKSVSEIGCNGFLAWLAGFWLALSVAEPLPHAPAIRKHQGICGLRALEWLQERV